MTAPQKPWMQPLNDAARARVRKVVAQAEPLTDDQRHRLRELFRGGTR